MERKHLHGGQQEDRFNDHQALGASMYLISALNIQVAMVTAGYQHFNTALSHCLQQLAIPQPRTLTINIACVKYITGPYVCLNEILLQITSSCYTTTLLSLAISIEL